MSRARLSLLPSSHSYVGIERNADLACTYPLSQADELTNGDQLRRKGYGRRKGKSSITVHFTSTTPCEKAGGQHSNTGLTLSPTVTLPLQRPASRFDSRRECTSIYLCPLPHLDYLKLRPHIAHETQELRRPYHARSQVTPESQPATRFIISAAAFGRKQKVIRRD